jgi:hypothetical protein
MFLGNYIHNKKIMFFQREIKNFLKYSFKLYYLQHV